MLLAVNGILMRGLERNSNLLRALVHSARDALTSLRRRARIQESGKSAAVAPRAMLGNQAIMAAS